MQQPRTGRSAKRSADWSRLSEKEIKKLMLDCAGILNGIASNLPNSKQSRIDPAIQVLIRGVAICGEFMTDMAVDLQKQQGFKSLPLDLPYKGMF